MPALIALRTWASPSAPYPVLNHRVTVLPEANQ